MSLLPTVMTSHSYTTPERAQLPVTVYYDHSCVLCRSEIEYIKARDTGDQLRMVDCSPLGFDTQSMPVNQTGLMNCIHAVDSQGNWLKSTDVFVVCYRTVELAKVARFFMFSKPLLERVYPLIVRYRHVFSALGVHTFFNFLTRKHLNHLRIKANIATTHSQMCKDQDCKM